MRFRIDPDDINRFMRGGIRFEQPIDISVPWGPATGDDRPADETAARELGQAPRCGVCQRQAGEYPLQYVNPATGEPEQANVCDDDLDGFVYGLRALLGAGEVPEPDVIRDQVRGSGGGDGE